MPEKFVKEEGKGSTTIELADDGTFKLNWRWSGEGKSAEGGFTQKEGSTNVKLSVKTADSFGIQGTPVPSNGDLTYDLA